MIPNTAVSHRRAKTCLLAATMLVSLLAVAGCSKPFVKKYETAVATNYRNMQGLQLGMSEEEVQKHMGRGHYVDHKRVQLRNPWRTEAFRVNESLEVEVLYYVTQGYVWQGYDDRHATTPVVIENGRVAGWGWGYLDRNRDRFIAAPAPAAKSEAKK